MELEYLFYAPTVDDAGLYVLDAEEARHASRALRLGVGDELAWTDGRGAGWRGRIEAQQRDGMLLRPARLLPAANTRPLRLIVGALHDAARLEWLAEKATELGVTRFDVVATARTQRTRYRMARLRAKALAAMKQSRRFVLPELKDLPFAEAIATLDGSGVVAHCHGDLPRQHMREVPLPLDYVIIGPEGDLTAEEVADARARGAVPVSLGSTRLRTETAAVSALAYAQLAADA